MSTPGRKRVQPILIDDDDDDDDQKNNENRPINNEFLLPKLSSNSNIEESQPPLPLLTNVEQPSSTISHTNQPVKKNLYVALNFEELSRIRNVQTNSEFATLLYDFKLYKSVVNGHICFTCRKVKFSLLQPGMRCTICLQRICLKCHRKMNYRPDNICFVSLNLLRRSSISSSNDITIRRNERTNSESSVASFSSTSSSSSFTITTGNKHKQFNKKTNLYNSFSCCIDCFILFDPASLV